MRQNSTDKALRQPFILTPDEQVQRQQLNILDYWGNKQQEGFADETSVDHPDAKSSVSESEVWRLIAGIEMHNWQRECSQKWFESGHQGVVKVVTGAGKTILACAIIERLQNQVAHDLRVAVVVPTVVLLGQWYDLLKERSNLPAAAIGRLGGGFKDGFAGSVRILISVLNSAATRLPELASRLQSPLLLVVDECHRAGAAEMSKVFATRRTFNLGLSATPEREEVAAEESEDADATGNPSVDFDETVLGRELGSVIYELDYQQAVEHGILSRFVISHYGLPLEPAERIRYEHLSREISELRRFLQTKVRGGPIDGGMLVGWARRVASRGQTALARQAAEYVSLTGQRKQLLYHAKARESAVARLVQEALRNDQSSRIILFHEAIAEVMRLFQRLRAEGFSAVAEHSQLPDSLRQESVHLFRMGSANVLVSARSLIEGFDVPAADVGIVVASSSSARQRIQTLGRILRKKSAAAHQKPALLHVLYASETTDELIYEKEDWDRLTGAERNRYFTWDPTAEESQPIERPGPPRRPKARESDLDWTTLRFGDTYPGAYEGLDFTSDAQGNVRDATGTLMQNPQGIPALIKELRGGYGRFRVTTGKQALLVPTHNGEESKILFGGFVSEPFIPKSEVKMSPFHDAAVSTDSGVPGAEYSGPAEECIELRVQAKAAGPVLAKKVPNGEAYARTTKNASDRERGLDAEAIIAALLHVERQEQIKVTRIKVSLESRVAFCEAGGRRLFLHKLKSGLEFKDEILGMS